MLNLYIVLFLFALLISSCTQILLKQSAVTVYKKRWMNILNFKVILAYSILIICMIFTTISYRSISIKLGMMLECVSYFYIMIIDFLVFKEKITKKRIVGNLLIVSGVVLSVLK